MQYTFFLYDTDNKKHVKYSRSDGSRLPWNKVNQERGMGSVGRARWEENMGYCFMQGIQERPHCWWWHLNGDLRWIREEPIENLQVGTAGAVSMLDVASRWWPGRRVWRAEHGKIEGPDHWKDGLLLLGVMRIHGRILSKGGMCSFMHVLVYSDCNVEEIQ